MGREVRFAQRVVFCVGSLPWLGLPLLAVLTFSSVLLGQMSQSETSEDSQAVVHLPTDWSHHHLLFSNPATAEQLKRVQQEPRYWQQLFRRSQATPPEAESDMALPFELPHGSKTSTGSKSHKLKRDWSEPMGTGATVGAGQYPGKFGFDVTTSSCANDFAIFNTSLAGAAGQASIIAYNNLYPGCPTGTVPSGYFAYNTNGGTISTSVTLSPDGTQLAFVQAQGGVATLGLLKWAQNAASTAFSPAQLTISTTPIQVSGCSWGFFFQTTITCTNAYFTVAFDVGATISGGGLPGGDTITAVNSSTQITVSQGSFLGGSNQTLTITPQNTSSAAVSGCSWNGATNSEVTCTSGGFTAADVGAAIILNDGFPSGEIITAVDSAETVTVFPALPTSGPNHRGSAASGDIYVLSSLVTPANYRKCTAPCMTSITLNGSPAVTYSSPFYDFSGTDSLYIGDDTGKLHQFTGVFLGTPAETTSNGYPLKVATAILSSPIYDSTTGTVFVASSYNTANNGGRIHSVCAAAPCSPIGTITASGILGPTTTHDGSCHNPGTSGDGNDMRLDSPVIDPVAGMVYAFLGNDGAGNSAVIQLPMGFTSQDCGTEVKIGTASTTGVPVFAGTFDNLYYTSTGGTPSGSKPSGNLYVCGNTSGAPELYQVPITSNAMATSSNTVLPAAPALSSGSTTCSPVAEVYNGLDYIYLSVETKGATTSPVGCPSSAGCVMSFSVPTTSGGSLPAATTATATESGGTSGIVIDNIVTLGSEIYFSTLTGSNAVQASQSGLN